jgi:hypothetical protein
MPPHCDSLDGPVVRAAHMALVHGDVNLALPYVPASAEDEVRAAFDRAMHVREMDPLARELGELHFFETVVRLHRQGEGAPFTGLRPMGLDVGPIIPVAEEAAYTADPSPLLDALHNELDRAIVHRVAVISRLGIDAEHSVAQAREHVEAILGLQVWAQKVHQTITDGLPEHGSLEAA